MMILVNYSGDDSNSYVGVTDGYDDEVGGSDDGDGQVL